MVDADSLLDAIGVALASDADLLDEAERATLDEAMQALRDAIAAESTKDINACSHRLNQASEPFAARRMDRNIQRALTGKNIETL
ncbi:chaperone protein HscA [compost metagenome]